MGDKLHFRSWRAAIVVADELDQRSAGDGVDGQNSVEVRAGGGDGGVAGLSRREAIPDGPADEDARAQERLAELFGSDCRVLGV
ncbi:MAG: hypothetical protein E6I03_11670 [Chloroflexi bacterium]|nr:MAG: hypothetical protein E6I03_11670 [Chloroflexota bacterium]